MTAPAIITRFRNLVDPVGSESNAESWDAVFTWLSQPREFTDPKDHPGWSAARFEPCRRALEHVRSVYALTLDYDHEETVEGILERLAGYFGLLHTTRRHTPESHRFRVVLPLSRPVSPFEYSALWVRFANFAGSVDEAPKDPSRFWFAPGVPAGGEFRVERLSGAALDVDAWLARPDPTTPVTRVPASANLDQRGVEERAAQYIAKMDPAISGSGGHQATWAVAVALARGFALGEDATFRLLWNDYNPRCSPAWSEKALRHKAKQAQGAKVALGYILEQDRPEPRRRQSSPMPAPEYWDDGRDYDGSPDWAPAELMADERQPDDELGPPEVAPKTVSAAVRWGASSMREMLTEVFLDANNPKAARGLTTGIKELDTRIGGYRRGNVTVLGAQTSWGKSSLGVMALDENIQRGERVLVISCEDKRLLYGRRLACRMGDISALRMRDGALRPEELGELGHLADRATDDIVFLDAIGAPVETIALAVRELCKEIGFALVVVDYLQKLRSKRQLKRNEEVSLAANLIGDEIKRANAAGLLMSQLKRSDGKPPSLEDLKETGDIENAAEHVMIGWRVIDGNTVTRKIAVPKNKDGPVDDLWLSLAFKDKTANFTGHTVEAENAPDFGVPYDSFEN